MSSTPPTLPPCVDVEKEHADAERNLYRATVDVTVTYRREIVIVGKSEAAALAGFAGESGFDRLVPGRGVAALGSIEVGTPEIAGVVESVGALPDGWDRQSVPWGSNDWDDYMCGDIISGGLGGFFVDCAVSLHAGGDCACFDPGEDE